MIIGLDGTPLTQPTGGVARYTWELAHALARLYPADRYWLLSDQEWPVPDSLPLNLAAGSGPASPAERRWWLWGLSREMQRRGVDLFHGTDFSVPYIKRRPSVMTLHDLSPWIRWADLDPAAAPDADWQPGAGRARRRTPLLLRLGLATVVITPSEAVRRAAISRFSLAPERVVAIPLAAGEQFSPVEAPPAPAPYFLFVGTLEPRKNLARLIDAWRTVRVSHPVDLVLAGRVRSDFNAPASGAGLRVLGPVPEADLPRLYSGALATIYPSLYEGFGLPVLEAMQCGSVVITSRDPSIEELTGEATGSGAALHVDATDTRALAQAMRRIVESPGGVEVLRKRALARAADFSWTQTARRTHDVYRMAVRLHTRRRTGGIADGIEDQ